MNGESVAGHRRHQVALVHVEARDRIVERAVGHEQAAGRHLPHLDGLIEAGGDEMTTTRRRQRSRHLALVSAPRELVARATRVHQRRRPGCEAAHEPVT